MIVFKQVTAKNFLSYGNSPTTWYLDKDPSTLIIGKNGHGKSVLLDLVCYTVFGRPFRSINKPQLINSINQRGCVAELELTVDGVAYKIIRGMKPNIFDVYREGKKLDQEAAMRDMQEFLEQQILKLNYKTFCQVVILGSASFTPFMKLSAYQRREVIEDVLDIGIFSKMNQVLKDRIAANKEELRVVDVKVDSAKKETVAQKRIIELIEKNRTDRINEIEARKNDLLEKLRMVNVDVVRLAEDRKQYDEKKAAEIRARYSELTSDRSDLVSEETSLYTKMKRFYAMGTCPTCMQGISDDHKHTVGSSFNIQLEDITLKITNIDIELEGMPEKIAKFDKIEAHFKERETDNTAVIERLNESIAECNDQIERIKGDSGDVEAEREKLRTIADSALKVIQRRNDLLQEKQLQEISQVLLKDTGIKTAIIREYLPVLNKLINKYLQKFDFFVNFNLDESFSEVIKSRGRDDYSYANFSEGEKKKIDVALLFAFRNIASMKNSVRTNLLIMDEVVDSSLDLDARQRFNELLGEMNDTNVFVISHTDTSPDAYAAVIKVEKVGDFSKFDYV